MAKEDFKEFVKANPRLIRYIKNKDKTWQEFYELYDMYGDDNEAWGTYLSKETTKSNMDFVGMLKNVDLDSLQETISSIQRVLGLVGDLTIKDAVDDTKPIYKHLED